MEYWIFFFVNLAISSVLGFLGELGITITMVFALVTLIPSISVAIRRLHDIGKSGWWFLLILIPILGWITLFVFYCLDSQAGDNQWGENPKEA
ncbi:DUF805 domain-containing protein [Dichelobacter nodosus]|uniref:Inner membrane protein YhaI n=1 Tax=Dichelobacter nodosus (strain VCS1703A) TaxID=246195 RepID=A5EW51_DICNV|nr:DUF805 domain-containing protein [Dichelobacter nodosus]ABQ13634.1 conserved hypothetical protein [Dichelobacter nodosus VCS1703A]AXM45225.1 DUF805 domain-containing protein [Dichelobacter nodosus]KNZ39539.1 membrane protein [Dichelobacter nodosus]TGA64380.1 DUF805 domain-containing protein [Dichelobacter nodosus]